MNDYAEYMVTVENEVTKLQHSLPMRNDADSIKSIHAIKACVNEIEYQLHHKRINIESTRIADKGQEESALGLAVKLARGEDALFRSKDTPN